MRLAYRPQLDGVRAIAIILVVGFHAFGVPPGGYFGVDVFFVLSGYLITSLLTRELLDTRSLDLVGFYRRRAARLLPALFAMLAVFLIFCARDGDPSLIRRDVLGTLSGAFYCANLVKAYAPNDIPQQLGHLWSLAIEEQFYLLWPLVLLVLLRRSVTLTAAFLALAVPAAVVARTVSIAHGWTTAAHAYHAPWTRVDGLLLGSLVGLLAATGRLPRVCVEARPRRLLLGTASAGAIAAIGLQTFDASRVWWSGAAEPVVALAAALLILEVTAAERTPLAHVLSSSPMTYVGRLSYSLYLWHVPVLVGLQVSGNPGENLPGACAGVALSLVAATLSYSLVEVPARRWLRGTAERALLQPAPT